MADPLSHLAFAPAEEEDEVQTTFPDSKLPSKGLSRPASAADAPKTSQSDPDPLAAPSGDTLIEARMSYGDLLGSTPVGSPPQSQAQLAPEDAPTHLADFRSRPDPSPPASRPLSAAASCPYQITVSEPIKKAEPSMFPGMSGGYMTYLVTTNSSLPDFPRGGQSVRRRFRDFVALADLLKTTHRGYFVPPRPEKNPVEGHRAAPNFIEQRRGSMERFLQQLAAHPTLGHSRALRAFLCAEAPLGSSPEWTQLQPQHTSMLENVSRLPKQLLGQERSIPNPSEVEKSTKASGDLLRRFKEMKQSLTNELQEAPVLTDDEVALRNAKLAVEAFALRLATASQKAERAVSSFEEAGGVLGDLGMALIRLAKFEGEQGVLSSSYSNSAADCRSLAADTQRTGKAAVRLSRLSRTAEGQFTTTLEPLHDHLALAPAISEALREREASLLTLQALQDGRDRTQKSYNPADENSSDRKRVLKARALQDDLAALDLATEAAQGEYDKLTTRNQEELQRWRRDGALEYRALLNGFVRVNAAFSQRCQQAWLEVADEFGES